MQEITIQNEGHTTGCLLRNKLLKSAKFAACIVKHPQEKNLTIKIDSNNAKDIILDAVLSRSNELDKLIKTVRKSQYYNDMDTS